MEASTLELKPLRKENGQMVREMADDRSSSPYPAAVTPLPPYSDLDGNFVPTECNGFSTTGNTVGNRLNEEDAINSRSDRTIPAVSAFYAQIIFGVTAVLVFTEVLHGPIPLLFFSGYVFMYLIGGSVLIFIGIYIRIIIEKYPQFIYYQSETNREKSSMTFSRRLLNSDISIYFRLGAVVFGLGTLISSGLEVASIFTVQSKCMDNLNSIQAVLKGLFSLLQMHFIFMNTKEIIHALGWFRHVALMHLIATNLSIWISLVLQESAKDWLDAVHVKHNSSIAWPSKEFSIITHTLESDKKSQDVTKHIPVHNAHLTTNCYWRETEEVQKTEDLIALHLCLQNSTTGMIWEQAMPYLYSFVVQYSLAIGGVIYLMWYNLRTSQSKVKTMATVMVHREECNTLQTNCASCVKGLFLGITILVIGIISVILSFALAGDKRFYEQFPIMYLRCIIFGVSSAAAILGIAQIKKMKNKEKQQHCLMEVLQKTGVFVVYIFGICCMTVGGISLTSTQHLLLFLDGTLMVIQAFLQSLFIHQVLQKRAQPSEVNEKPGRNAVIFLIFCNLTLWLLESFPTHNQNSAMLQMKFFGPIAWPIILNIAMPLVIFYRFHSAVALMEAFNKSYKTEED